LSDLAGGQFEPDVLAALAITYEANGQDRLAQRTWHEILERFPRRAVADEARQALEPDDPVN
jgi:TolA-binding protein